jgi:hypothetical protein
MSSQDEVGIVGDEPEELPTSPGTREGAAGEDRLEVAGSLSLPSHRAWMAHLNRMDLVVEHVCGEPPAHDLDLGQLGHQLAA